MSKRRLRKGKIEIYIPPHKWKPGKTGKHPGYWRKKRPKGKKRIIGKKPILYSVRDEYGQWRGSTRRR